MLFPKMLKYGKDFRLSLCNLQTEGIRTEEWFVLTILIFITDDFTLNFRNEFFLVFPIAIIFYSSLGKS